MSDQSFKQHRPKGSYQLPDGNFATEKSFTGANGKRDRIVAVRRDQVDLRQFARALVAIARDQIEDEAKNQK